MQAFQIHRGIAVPLNRDNIDTDAMIPKQFLKSIKRTGFGENLFDAWRYLDTGELGKQQRIINPDFVLNQKQFAGASILLTGKNFGCGSSREHAPWALQQFGFRAIIAESYADIFFNNCFKIGLLPIVLAQSHIENLINQIKAKLGVEVTVDLERQVVVAPDQQAFAFEIEPFRRECLLNGWDDIGLTLRYAQNIRAFENERLAKMPWLNAELSS